MRQALRTGIVLPAAVVLAPDVVVALNAFRGEHQHCGDLDGGVADVRADAYLVWMSCAGCGARLRRWFGTDEVCA